MIFRGQDLTIVDLTKPVIDGQHTPIRVILPQQGILIQRRRIGGSSQFLIYKAEQEEHPDLNRYFSYLAAFIKSLFVDKVEPLRDTVPELLHFSGFFLLIGNLHECLNILFKGLRYLTIHTGKSQDRIHGILDGRNIPAAGFRSFLPLRVVQFRLLRIVFLDEGIRALLRRQDIIGHLPNLLLDILHHPRALHKSTDTKTDIRSIIAFPQELLLLRAGPAEIRLPAGQHPRLFWRNQ